MAQPIDNTPTFSYFFLLVMLPIFMYLVSDRIINADMLFETNNATLLNEKHDLSLHEQGQIP